MRRFLIVTTLLLAACGAADPSPAPASGGPTAAPSVAASPTAAASHPSGTYRPAGSVLLVGRIITMADPPEADAILIVDGRVAAIGSAPDVQAVAPPGTRVIDLGSNVAYPGFIDAHSHWIGDREYEYGPATADEAMQAAVSRGWTSIAELWVHEPRLDELVALDAAGRLLPRVDAYLALSDPQGSKRFGDWYADRVPGAVSDRLRVAGVKIHFDTRWGSQIWWEHDEVGDVVERANDLGWQVAIHTVGAASHDMVLDAFERALDGGPNVLHHRIEHAIQVTDAHIARMVELGIVLVIHTDGAASDFAADPMYLENLGADTSQLTRWRDFIDAGLHVASAVDTPWMFPDQKLTDDIGRAVDQVAGGIDGRGRINTETPAWVLEQLLTPAQSLAAITTEAAYAINDAANRGHLAVGTFGDVTILDGDITAGRPDDIRSLRVVATIVGGMSLYCAEPAYCP